MSVFKPTLVLVFIVVGFLTNFCSIRTSESDMEFFPMYVGKDIHAGRSYKTVIVVDRYVRVDRHLPLSKKVAIILDSVSTVYFGEAKLELLGVVTMDGLRIAKVNMVEKSDLSNDHFHNMDRAWYGYFQGTTGGGNTTTILTETILQRRYKDDWIDAVFFYWNHEPFPFEEMDHVKLSSIITRYPIEADWRKLDEILSRNID